jgi:hypothetical protein
MIFIYPFNKFDLGIGDDCWDEVLKKLSRANHTSTIKMPIMYNITDNRYKNEARIKTS